MPTAAFTGMTIEGLKQADVQVAVQAVEIGANIVSGMEWGINDNKEQLVASIVGVANAGVLAAQQALGVHSPSKVFEEIGKFTAEGFEIGIDKEMESVYRGISKRFQSTALIGAAPFAVSTPSGSGQVYNDNAHFEIVVNAAPGQSEDAIAEAVMERIRSAVQRKGAVFQ